MTDAVTAANAAIGVFKLVRLAELALDVLDKTEVSVSELVELRAAAKLEGRDHLNDAEMKQLTDKSQAAIDAII